MKGKLAVILLLIGSTLFAQSIFEKAAEALKNKLMEESQKITGEGAPPVTTIDEATASLFDEIWLYAEEETNNAHILRFTEDGKYGKSILNKGNPVGSSEGKWEIKEDVENKQFYVLLDGQTKLYFKNSRQLIIEGEKLYRKTPSYIMK